MRKNALALAAAAGLAAVAALLWWVLREEPVPEAPESSDPAEGRLDPLQQRGIAHNNPWPFGEFSKDIGELESPDPEAGGFVPDIKRNENERAIYFTKFSIRMVDVTVDEVVRELATRFRDAGVRIFTGPPPLPETLRVTVEGDDITITDVITQLRVQTNEECRYFMTWQGLCIGSEGAIQQAQLDANAAAGAMKAREDPPSPILDLEYRPGLEGAWIGAIARDVRAQTGVDVVVDSDLWTDPRTLTWRAKPMPLREALDTICRRMGAYHRVRDGRVFLLKP